MTPIALRGLHKAFGRVVAVEHVDLDVAVGELFFLLGPSGCGKTTLLRMIAGFTEPSGGMIRFGDRDVTQLRANKRNCGMVFQNYALWPHMTVRQNVAFGLDVRKVPGAEKQKRVEAALRNVQMLPYAERKPNELSGGQQQRVAVARALVIEPTVLLLDEPLSNLDTKLRLEMRGQIKRICRQAGITAIYVTHDQAEALSMADRIAVMNAGRIVQVGAPRELYERPVNRFVADFLGETNFLSAQIVARSGNRVTLESLAGKLESTAFPAELPPAGSVTCSIRPEAIRLIENNAAAPAVNCFSARHTDTVYLGEVAQYELALNDAVTLKMLELNPPPAHTAATTLRIAFDPKDVVILRD